MSEKQRNKIVLALSAATYFVFYPDDAAAITKPIATILSLTEAISPSFCGVIAVGIMATAIVRTWGSRTGTSKN